MPLGGTGYVRTLAAARIDGPARGTFTTAVTCLPEQARMPMAAADWYEGRTLRVTFVGRIGNISQPTFTFEFRLGPTSAIAVFSSGALLCSATGHTTLPIWGEMLMTVRSLGAGTAATIMGQARFDSRVLLDAGATTDITTLGHPSLLGPETNPAVGTGFDSNVQNVADLFVACSTSNAANTFQLTQYTLEDLGA